MIKSLIIGYYRTDPAVLSSFCYNTILLIRDRTFWRGQSEKIYLQVKPTRLSYIIHKFEKIKGNIFWSYFEAVILLQTFICRTIYFKPIIKVNQ